MAESESPERPDALAHVVLEGSPGDPEGSDDRQRDRDQAVADLQQGSRFAPAGLTGPFTLYLSVQFGRLVLDVRDMQQHKLRVFMFALSPFRRLIKDYQLLVESYGQAYLEGRTRAIQTIDMGRRALHDEGAALLVERLQDKIEIDFDTARRLFTLVCVLHQRS